MTDNATMPPEALTGEIAAIEKAMTEDSRAYWKDPGLQERYATLIRARDSGAGLPVQRGSRADVTAARRSEIEAMMRDTRSDYWRGPSAERLQGEYKRILEREAGARSSGPAPAAPVREGLVAARPDRAPDSDGRDLERDPAGSGRDGARVPAVSPLPSDRIASDFGLDVLGASVARDTAAGIAADLGPGLVEIEPVIAGMDDTLRVAIVSELSAPYLPRQPHAGVREVQEFQTTEAGKICAERWGQDTARRLGILQARIARFEQRLSNSDVDGWMRFWTYALGPKQRAAVLERLTG